jgi:hypothetical protein
MLDSYFLEAARVFGSVFAACSLLLLLLLS